MRLYLVRHGESVGNMKKLMFGHSDHPLTEAGVKDAQTVAEKLSDCHVECCYTSTLKRASHTAEICFKDRNVPIVYLDDLREQNMGLWEDCTFEDLTERYHDEFMNMMTDWTNNAPVGGESFCEVYERVTACVDDIISKGEDAAIVAHNGPLTMILIYLLKLDKKHVDNFYFNHGCYSVIGVDNAFKKGINALECFNR